MLLEWKLLRTGASVCLKPPPGSSCAVLLSVSPSWRLQRSEVLIQRCGHFTGCSLCCCYTDRRFYCFIVTDRNHAQNYQNKTQTVLLSLIENWSAGCISGSMLLFCLTVFWWMFWGPEGPSAASGAWMKGPTPGTRLSLSLLKDKAGGNMWSAHTHLLFTSHTLHHTVTEKLTVVWLDSAFRVQRCLLHWQTLLWCKSFRSFSRVVPQTEDLRPPGVSEGAQWVPTVWFESLELGFNGSWDLETCLNTDTRVHS